MEIPKYLLEAKDFRTIECKSETVETLKSERAIVHYISTPQIDSIRDSLNPKGMKDRDGVIPVWYNHSYKSNTSALPIAKSIWRKIRDEGVLTKTIFSDLDFADDVYTLHIGGFINNWSVGLQPVFDKEGNIKSGSIVYDEKKNITRFEEWTLLEYSSAPMPMNVGAKDVIKSMMDMNLKSDITKGYLSEASFKIDVKEALESFKSELTKIAELEEVIKTLNSDELLQGLENAEKRILELENEINLIKNPIKKSIETLDGKLLLEQVKRNIVGDVISTKIKEK